MRRGRLRPLLIIDDMFFELPPRNRTHTAANGTVELARFTANVGQFPRLGFEFASTMRATKSIKLLHTHGDYFHYLIPRLAQEPEEPSIPIVIHVFPAGYIALHLQCGVGKPLGDPGQNITCKIWIGRIGSLLHHCHTLRVIRPGFGAAGSWIAHLPRLVEQRKVGGASREAGQ